MSSDVFRRVGRGGAGNFFSKKEVEDAQNAQPQVPRPILSPPAMCLRRVHSYLLLFQDPEAQKPKSPTADDAAAAAAAAQQHSSPAYARAGRGGAGNFHDAPPTIDDSLAQEEALRRTNAAVSASLARPRAGGLSGRGGAGNWSDDTAQGERETQDRRQQQEIEAKIAHDVEASLQMPGKTYHQHDREME